MKTAHLFASTVCAVAARPSSPRNSFECHIILYAMQRREHTPLDATAPEHAAIVAKLKAIADKYALTKVPQAVGDPDCPQFSGLNTTAPDGTTKLYIGPWCDGK